MVSSTAAVLFPLERLKSQVQEPLIESNSSYILTFLIFVFILGLLQMTSSTLFLQSAKKEAV
jgi:hypothetical protein